MQIYCYCSSLLDNFRHVLMLKYDIYGYEHHVYSYKYDALGYKHDVYTHKHGLYTYKYHALAHKHGALSMGKNKNLLFIRITN